VAIKIIRSQESMFVHFFHMMLLRTLKQYLGIVLV
jgi:hypothetical protein